MEPISKQEYCRVHNWLREKYGAPNFCENPFCSKISVEYEWAKLKDLPYECKRENFVRLCIKCHRNYDSSLLFKRQLNKKPDIIRPSLAIKIKEIRLQLRMSQRAFAKTLGVSQASASGYETGERVPLYKVLKAIDTLAKKHEVKIYLLDD